MHYHVCGTYHAKIDDDDLASIVSDESLVEYTDTDTHRDRHRQTDRQTDRQTQTHTHTHRPEPLQEGSTRMYWTSANCWSSGRTDRKSCSTGVVLVTPDLRSCCFSRVIRLGSRSYARICLQRERQRER